MPSKVYPKKTLRRERSSKDKRSVSSKTLKSKPKSDKKKHKNTKTYLLLALNSSRGYRY